MLRLFWDGCYKSQGGKLYCIGSCAADDTWVSRGGGPKCICIRQCGIGRFKARDPLLKCPLISVVQLRIVNLISFTSREFLDMATFNSTLVLGPKGHLYRETPEKLDAQTQGLIAVGVIFMATVWVSTALRVYVRGFLIKAFGMDDVFAVMTTVCQMMVAADLNTDMFR